VQDKNDENRRPYCPAAAPLPHALSSLSLLRIAIAVTDLVMNAMSEIKFSCTMCGRCCQNHSIPLTLDEAICWLEDGGKVGIFCEADLWLSEPPKENLRAAHRRKRSFAVSCGSSRARVTAIFVAITSGACKNLDEDLKCRIYERRPLVCRIYPAEISPFIQLNPASKACPPEAWGSGNALIADVQLLVEKSRQVDRNDVPQKELLCGYLGIDVAAVAGEGFVTYEPDRGTFLNMLRRARLADPEIPGNGRAWRLYSPSLTTTESLRSAGVEMIMKKRPDDTYSFFPDSSARPAESFENQ
jgi:Fe-S-cluster containining protein